MPYIDTFAAAVPTANREVYMKHVVACARIFR
jgi:uncharacterized protein YbaA (DUF1428 family)